MADSFRQDAYYRIVNEGDTVFQASYDNIPYYIEPGADAVVPYGFLVTHFGNPNAIDDGRNNHRRAEYERIRTLYGAYDNDELWEENRPRFKVVTMAGDPVPTVVDDPTGANISPAVQTQIENDLMKEAIAKQQAEIETMKARIAANEHEERSTEDNQMAEDFEEVTEDTPKAPRVRNPFQR